MKSMQSYAVLFGTAALMGASATALSAADLEFYFPVGVNAPAVETIEALFSFLNGKFLSCIFLQKVDPFLSQR